MVESLVPSHVPESPAPRLDTTSFVSGGTFTVGAEEELFLLDASGALDPTAIGLLQRRLSRESHLRGTVSTELYAAEIEFATTVCADAEQLMGQVRRFRRAAVAVGARMLACGLHPDAPFGQAVLTDAPRYALIGHHLAGLLRTPTAAFQVHVGLPDEASAMLAYRGIRHRLAVLQALASNSPFWHGRDSGLASARWGVISSYPRGGVPPVVGTWGEYVDLVSSVQAAAEAPDLSHVWFDARLRPGIGTIEIRVMDAQPSPHALAGLAALVQGVVRHAVEVPVEVDVPSAVLAENNFRVARHGLETTIADVDGTLRPVRSLAARMVEEARSMLRPDRLDVALDGVQRLLAEETDYARQRRLHAQHGMPAVVADLAARTCGA